ncbi:MAG: FG-GAP repeat domain-containing protein, partial [Planctomycetota bacterium]
MSSLRLIGLGVTLVTVGAALGCGVGAGGSSSSKGSSAAAITSGAGANTGTVSSATTIAPGTSATRITVAALAVVANSSASAPPIAAGFTAIEYTAYEPKGAPVTVLVEVDLADGKGFRVARQAPNAPGVPFKSFTIEGTTDVAAKATGTRHVFLWDSGTDARGVTTDKAQIRIAARARGVTSAPALLANVSIRNATATSPRTGLAAPRRAVVGDGTTQFRQAILVDVNRDGKRDLVAVDQNAALVWTFVALGDGAFAAPSVLSAASLPF